MAIWVPERNENEIKKALGINTLKDELRKPPRYSPLNIPEMEALY
jgi:hypothetical protein